MRLTKTEMAQVIVTALYNRPDLVKPTDPRVAALVKRSRVATLQHQHQVALRVIEQRGEPT